MKTKGYLIVSHSGSLRVAKKLQGALKLDEVAIALDIQIPDAAFKPIIQATISINEKDVSPMLISTGKLNKTSEILSNEIGFKVVLKSIDVESPIK